MLVGIYVSCMESVKVLHSMSSICGGVLPKSFCLPIRAISLLKSPHKMWT